MCVCVCVCVCVRACVCGAIHVWWPDVRGGAQTSDDQGFLAAMKLNPLRHSAHVLCPAKLHDWTVLQFATAQATGALNAISKGVEEIANEAFLVPVATS